MLKARGGYEKTPALRLSKAEFLVAVLHPRQRENFARLVGKLVKIDPINAWLLTPGSAFSFDRDNEFVPYSCVIVFGPELLERERIMYE